MRAFLLVLVACSSERAPEPKPQPVQQTPPADAPALAEAPLVAGPAERPPPEPPRAKAGARWSNTETGTGCFYFSGPTGRDTHLGNDIAISIDGDRVTVKWSGTTFTGTLKDGILDVKRTGHYTFGEPWTTTERLRGPYREGLLEGTYTYEECERGQTCPGECKVKANFTVTP